MTARMMTPHRVSSAYGHSAAADSLYSVVQVCFTTMRPQLPCPVGHDERQDPAYKHVSDVATSVSPAATHRTMAFM